MTRVFESEASYRAWLESMPLSDLLPSFESEAGGIETAGMLVTSPNAYLPDVDDWEVEQQFTTLALLDVGDAGGGPSATSTVAAGSGATAYATDESYYLADHHYGTNENSSTRLFKFTLGTDAIPLAATGEVEGLPVSQFSMDEEGDNFRIATHNWAGGVERRRNALFVLRQSGDALEVIGSIRDLAPGESLRSVRFVGDKAYLVTLPHRDLTVTPPTGRGPDPLFTIDLSDPRRPRVAGELEVPGVSAYLHPLPGGLLVGVGRDLDEYTHSDRGRQVSLFDVSDPSSPKRLDALALTEYGGYTGAEYDHQAFTYFPDTGILVLNVRHETGLLPKDTLVVLRVNTAAGKLERLAEVETGGWVHRTLWIGDVLYAVGPAHIQARDLNEPEKVLGTLETVEADGN